MALQDISDAMDCWMEFIRIDPTDLIDDQPYNKIIFTPTVKLIQSFFIFIDFSVNRVHQTSFTNDRFAQENWTVLFPKGTIRTQSTPSFKYSRSIQFWV